MVFPFFWNWTDMVLYIKKSDVKTIVWKMEENFDFSEINA